MNITFFQALTLLAEKYRDNLDVYTQIKFFYLSGINLSGKYATEHNRALKKLLLDDALNGYNVKVTWATINNDPVRRYFESHLCVETLATSLDTLNFDYLNYYYFDVINMIKEKDLWELYEWLLISPDPNTADEDDLFSIRMENTEGMRILKLPESYPALKPKKMEESEAMAIWSKRKNKMLFLANISYASWVLANFGGKLPIDIYNDVDGPYNEIDRGREFREGQETVQPYTLGIMNSYMPLSLDDGLFASEPARFTRPADKSTYVRGAKQPKIAFKSLVTPFVNSISGTMLTQLKVMAEMVFAGNFVYNQCDKQLKLYFKAYIAYMTYFSGGHSLDEYTRVLQLPAVKQTFKFEPAFGNFTLDNLFQHENNIAFEAAVSKTIAYNQYILNKKKINMEIEPAVSERKIKQTKEKMDRTFIELVSTVKNKEINKLLNSPYDKNKFFHTVSVPETSETSRDSFSPTSITFTAE